MRDGAEAQLVFELTRTPTDQDYGDFGGMHIASHQKKVLKTRRINGWRWPRWALSCSLMTTA